MSDTFSLRLHAIIFGKVQGVFFRDSTLHTANELKLVGWVRNQRGTASLRALVYFDEIFGFLPPVANPPSKAPLLTILKQARAFGLGLIAATQNPVDLDYKALANTGTWMLGRLQTDRDKARLLDGLEGAAAGSQFDRASMDKLLSSLGKRQFVLHNVHEQQPTVFETRWTLSYLRGPLGREEIKKLLVRAVPEVPSLPNGAALGTTGTAGIRDTSSAPVLDPSIPQFFVPDATTYAPMILGVARIAYSDAKLGLDETKTIAVVTPITDGAVAVDWERAEMADFRVDGLVKAPPGQAAFAEVPAAAARPKNYATWEKDFSRWVSQTQSIELLALSGVEGLALSGVEGLRSNRAWLLSTPDESERDFRIRIQGEAREARDGAVARVRDKYASKLTTLQDRIRRAEHAVQVQTEQASSAKMGAALSAGAAIFGALLGRKAISAANIGRASTAARGMGRIGKESQDVTRATENVNALNQQLAEVEASMQEDIQAVTADWDLANEPFERVLVKPKRGGISVQLVTLVWVPA